jgi:3-deoxy-D-manno-octulosonate 8-phosphate phosphatase (KDO 8-P phosphatase)
MTLHNQTYLKAKHIKLLILDVDGVLTDGGLYFSDEGIELKRFHSLDGLGIKLLQENNIEVAIISARNAPNVAHRMKNLGIKHFFQGKSDKLEALNTLLTQLDCSPNEIAYVGDDVIDLPVMRKIGLAIAVKNAHNLVKENADYITQKPGGNGAVREVCDFILKAQNLFDETMRKYLK